MDRIGRTGKTSKTGSVCSDDEKGIGVGKLTEPANPAEPAMLRRGLGWSWNIRRCG